MLSSRSWRTIAVISPDASSTSLGSGRSKSSEPRSWRRRAHQLGELVHRDERRDERREALARRGVAVHDRLRLLVGEPRRAPDHAVVEHAALDAPARVDVDHGGLRQAGPSLDQAADVARQRVRQHRHHAVGK
jgi:hypothetical protein